MGALHFYISPSITTVLPFLYFVCFHSAHSQQNNGNINTNPYWHRELLDTNGAFQLEWLVDWEQERVLFNVTVATRGWVGFGLARNSKMEGADIVIGGMSSNGRSYFSDRHAIGNQQPILDESQDWVLHSAWENRTHTFLSVSRPFDTCDMGDIPINDDALYLLWAYGERDDEAGKYHFENRGSSIVYLRDPDYTPRSVHEANQKARVTGALVSAKVNDAQIWTINENFIIPAKRTIYWCNIKKFSPSMPGKKHIIGYNIWINPDALQNMHHMFLFRCASPTVSTLFEPLVEFPGQECYGASRVEQLGPILTPLCTEVILGHAIGGKPSFFPEHFGVPIGETGADEYYLLQVHYDNQDFMHGTINLTMKWDIYYTQTLRENDAASMSIGHSVPGSPSILLPPGQQDHKTYGHCSPTCTQRMLPAEGIKITTVLLHSHLAGRRVKVRHFRNGRELPWILNDDNYKFHFQPYRMLRDDLVVLPGDQVTVRKFSEHEKTIEFKEAGISNQMANHKVIIFVECYYDTMTRNKSTVAGFGTYQEMCQIFIGYYSPLVDYPLCRSGIRSREYMMDYLAGTSNVTWSYDSLEYVAAAPPHLAGMTLSQISDSQYVNWNVEQRNRLRRDHIVHPQVEECPNVRALALGQVETPPELVTFPVEAREYEPPQRCTLNGI